MTTKLGLKQVFADDVFVVSYPRSGNSWIRFLIANLLAPKKAVLFSDVERLVPDIHRSQELIETLRPKRFIKSHFPIFDQYPRFIYIYRDGRDALASFYHYDKAYNRFAGEFSDYLRQNLPARFGSWSDHVNGAHQEAEKRPDDVLLIKYEDLLEYPHEQTSRIAAFCRIKANDRIITKAVSASDFNNLKQIESKNGTEIGLSQSDADSVYFRSGRSGAWRHIFSNSDLEAFHAEAGETRKRLGYPKQ